MSIQRDPRDDPVFRELESLAARWFRPGEDRVCDATEHAVAPHGDRVAFTATMLPVLDGAPVTRIAVLAIATGAITIVGAQRGIDRRPRWSPDGATLYFLSDRDSPGRSQVYAVDVARGAVRSLACAPGSVETIELSPDGRRLLLVVAADGADLAGAQGGVAQRRCGEPMPPWIPSVEGEAYDAGWRSAWLLDLTSDEVARITRPGTNVWEACWCSDQAIAIIASDRPHEAAWYGATVRRIALDGSERVIHGSQVQCGWISAAPSGRRIAFAEAVCSDRLILAGELRLVDELGTVRTLDTHGVDVAWLGWAGESRLVYAGFRGLQTVVGCWEAGEATTQLWAERERTLGTRFGLELALAPGDGPAFVATASGFAHAPAIIMWDGTLDTLHDLGLAAHDQSLPAFRAEPVAWRAPDGLEIEAWLLRPAHGAQHPLILEIHGGPVFLHRARYVGTNWNWVALLRRGYAILLPNPRGSSGRGQIFAMRVVGDMGGADTQDLLSGVDHLVASGIADPRRLGVIGVSYGGYMTAWLVTQDRRFRAAVAASPVTNWVSQHLTCHVGAFCETFLGEPMTRLGGRYYTRSPVLHAADARTPTLNVCGALDRNTPPGQAREFHNALREHGVESALVTYPHEGHGVRGHPAVFDYGARVVDWFERHLR